MPGIALMNKGPRLTVPCGPLLFALWLHQEAGSATICGERDDTQVWVDRPEGTCHHASHHDKEQQAMVDLKTKRCVVAPSWRGWTTNISRITTDRQHAGCQESYSWVCIRLRSNSSATWGFAESTGEHGAMIHSTE